MKSYEGYLKQKFGDDYLLLAGGGSKKVSELFDSIATLSLTGNSTTTAPGILDILDNTGDIEYPRTFTMFAPNLTEGKGTYWIFGKEDSKYNCGHLGFKYNSDESASNYIELAIHSTPNLVTFLANGNVGIGRNDPSYKLHTSGTGRFDDRLYVHNWIQFDDSSGLYLPSSGSGTHLQPANNCTYGSFQMSGAKNSYCGITAGDSNTYPTFMGHSTHQGLYNASTGCWMLYYNRDSNRVGINTSSLSGWPITMGGSTYVSGEFQSTGRIYLNEWIQILSWTGLYSPNNGAHFLPNNVSSYGTWRITGARNGYHGLQLGDNTHYMCLMDNYSDKGLYLQDWAWILYHNGDTTYLNANRFYVNSGGTYFNSDRSLKKDIKVIPAQSLESLFNAGSYLLKSFTWKSTNKPSFGFIAQELEEFIPEAVEINISTKKKSVNYNVAYAKIIASLIYKIKELEKEIVEIKNGKMSN